MMAGSAQAQRTSYLWIVGMLICAGIALFSYRYLLQLGPVPAVIARNHHRTPWLVLHVAGAATALLVGSFQFLPRIRLSLPSVHRWNGRVYVVACLLGSNTGLVLALGATTGPWTTAGFASLAVLWCGSTILGWRAARLRRLADHRAWMVRSFALTLAAVTLRVYVPILLLLPVPFATGYSAISFLCWVPNLMAAEAFLRRARGPRPPRPDHLGALSA
jgi:uncharacterized membrane protein